MSNANNVTVLLGNGNGTFQSAVNFATGASTVSVAVADFNADGYADIVAATSTGNVSVLLGKGDGTFQASVGYAAGKSVQSVAVGDFNGDGRPDLVVADAGTNSLGVLLGNGNGTFQAVVSYAAGSQPIFVAVGDFIGTGRTDLAVSNFTGGNVSVLIGTPAPPTSPHIALDGVSGAGLSTPAVKSLSSNAIATVFGDAFAPAGTLKVVGSDDLVIGRLPTIVNGVCVYVNNVIAPLFFLNPNQINFQVPQVPAGVTVPVQVATACGTANEVRSPVQPVTTSAATPEFFYFTHTADAKSPIAALNAVNGNYIGPAGLLPGVTFVAAAPGDILTMFFTGGGKTDPAFTAGELPVGGGNVTGFATVSVAGTQLASSDILYLGVAPGFAGLYQLNIRVPAGTPAGNQPVILTIGGTGSPPGYLLIG